MGKFRSFADRVAIAAYAEECVEWIDLREQAERRYAIEQVRSLNLYAPSNTNDSETTKVG